MPTHESGGWGIYYDTGHVARAHDCDVQNLPAEGVVVVVQRDDAPGDVYAVGRELIFDRDYYCWQDGRWFGCDLYGMNDYLRRPGWKKVLFGRWTDRANYKRLLLAAQHDPEFPPKSTFQHGEERLRDELA